MCQAEEGQACRGEGRLAGSSFVLTGVFSPPELSPSPRLRLPCHPACLGGGRGGAGWQAGCFGVMWVTWGRFSLRCSSSPEGLTCRVGITPTDCYPGDMGGPMGPSCLPAIRQLVSRVKWENQRL